ncbi:lysoplasmalogenase [Perognathus longimembris pacificus]|uniref:lysoplasmalogenase n=1 Tax=Perognathus longimembris pacificus TaxID=214514 RepID=UPI002019F096|nr:lysoplasmalogenase [Perognathus longimembris pacificus]
MDTRKKGVPLKTSMVQVSLWLSPFFVACAIYFLVWIPENHQPWVNALVKCLPVLCLVVFLWAVAPSGAYTRLLQGALVCSAVGDACLIWPEAFIYGMMAFAAAHLLYVRAFGLSPLRPGLLLYLFLASLVYYSCLLPHLEPYMVLPVVAYGLVLTAMLWRGLTQGGCAAWGALLFTFSDGVLAWNSFAWPLPYAHLVTMVTYYAAQVLLALSALGSLGLKMH